MSSMDGSPKDLVYKVLELFRALKGLLFRYLGGQALVHVLIMHYTCTIAEGMTVGLVGCSMYLSCSIHVL